MRVDWCVSSWFRIKNTHSRLPVLGCMRFSSRTPSVFLSFFLSTTPSLFLSLFGKLRGNRQILGSELREGVEDVECRAL